MDSYITSKVKADDICTRIRTNVGQATGLIPMESSVPMEIVCIDYLSLELSNEIVENILVITDHFTGYVQAIPKKVSDSQDCC